MHKAVLVDDFMAGLGAKKPVSLEIEVFFSGFVHCGGRDRDQGSEIRDQRRRAAFSS
jgi:hypothetical protein